MMSKDATPGAESVEVTQADREAAAGVVVPHGRWPGFPSDFLTGRADRNELVQAFARHRLASYEAGRAEGVRAAAEVADKMAAAVRTKLGRGAACDAVTAMAAEILDNAAKHIRALSKEPTK